MKVLVRFSEVLVGSFCIFRNAGCSSEVNMRILLLASLLVLLNAQRLPAIAPEDKTAITAQIESLVGKILTDRNRIESGHVTITSKDGVEKSTILHEFWFDREHSRYDRVDLETAKAEMTGRRIVLCKYCPTKGYYIRHSFSPNAPVATAAEALKIIDPDAAALAIFDTRTLGLSLPGLTTEAKMNDLFRWPPEVEQVLATEQDDKDRYLTVVTTIPGRDLSAKLWFSETKDRSLVKAENRTGEMGKSYVSTMSCEMELQTNLKCWLPSKIEFTRLLDAKIIKHREYAIQYESMNQPLDPALFTIEGIQLPPGTTVVRNRYHNPYDVIDKNGKPVEYDPATGGEKIIDPTAPRFSNSHRKSILLAAGLILLSALAYRLIRRKRN